MFGSEAALKYGTEEESVKLSTAGDSAAKNNFRILFLAAATGVVYNIEREYITDNRIDPFCVLR